MNTRNACIWTTDWKNFSVNDPNCYESYLSSNKRKAGKIAQIEGLFFYSCLGIFQKNLAKQWSGCLLFTLAAVLLNNYIFPYEIPIFFSLMVNKNFFTVYIWCAWIREIHALKLWIMQFEYKLMIPKVMRATYAVARERPKIFRPEWDFLLWSCSCYC